jgi:hypothetical protein
MSDWRDRETPRLANLKRDLAECIARIKELEAERDMLNRCVTQCLECTERLNAIRALAALAKPPEISAPPSPEE